MFNVNVDFINMAGQMQGDFAAYLAQGGRLDPGLLRPFFDPKSGRSFVTCYKGHGDPAKLDSYHTVPIQGNASLRYDDWKAFDDAALRAARTRLVGIQDLIDNNLTFPIANGMGVMILQGTTVNDAGEAILSMDGSTKSKDDAENYENTYLPLPICHADFKLNSRAVEASRRNGHAIDTTGIEQKTRKVNEQLESMLFTDTTYAFGGGTIYSYLNEPNINELTLSVNWDNASKTPQQIVTEVRNMKQRNINALHFGDCMLYIPTAYETVMDDDYYTGVSDTTKAGTSDTIRDRILKIDKIKDVKVIDTLPANTVVLAEMSPETVRLVQGLATQVVEWKTGDMMTLYFKIMTIQVPQVRSDQNGKSGITVLS
ncbi:MAG: major capsid protein [Planctomycetota bacterium]|jgi:uncharacterized linocin/CFP29 family protein